MPPKKTGRKLLNIDSKQVEQFASVGATNVEIAEIMECDEATIRKRFSENLTKGRAQRKIRLRQAQWKVALGQEAIINDDGKIIKEAIPPNVTMLIWLGKNDLGQTDKTEIEWEHNIEEVKFIEIK